jgi:tetratricopeptide (TPR) repeat protein
MKNFKKTVLIALCTLLIANCFCQNKTIDSLNLALKNAKHDTSRAATLVALTEELVAFNIDTVIPLCWQALALIEKLPTFLKKEINVQRTQADALNNIGFIYGNQGQIPEALEYYGKSLKIYEELPMESGQAGDKRGIATSLNNIGAIYHNQGQIPEAIEYYGKSLKIQEEIGDKRGIANSLNNLGYIFYHNQGQIPEALDYFGRSLKIEEEIGNKSGIAISLNNIGLIYYAQGQAYTDHSNFDNHGERDSLFNKALYYYEKSLKIHEELGDMRGIATSLNNIGVFYHNQGKALSTDNYRGSQKEIILNKALYYFGRSLKFFEELGDKQGIAFSLHDLASIEMIAGVPAGAKAKATRALQIGQEIGFPRIISINSLLLSNIAKSQGNYEYAMTMYELHIQMRDSINNENTQKTAIRQQTKYEFEKEQLLKEQKLKEESRKLKEETERRDNIQYSMIFLGILLVFGSVLGLGYIKVSPKFAEGLIFFAFLIFFEFCLVLLDPIIDDWSSGEPIYKLLFNALLAGMIFPLHAFFEKTLKKRIINE